MRRACIVFLTLAAVLVGQQASASVFVLILLHGGIANNAQGPAGKVYGPDIMSVAELAECLRKADQLDKDDGTLFRDRQTLSSKDVVPALLDYFTKSNEIGMKRGSPEHKALLDRMAKRRSDHMVETRLMEAAVQMQADLYDANVKAYQQTCRKQYYRDDLEAAKRASGLQFK